MFRKATLVLADLDLRAAPNTAFKIPTPWAPMDLGRTKVCPRSTGLDIQQACVAVKDQGHYKGYVTVTYG